MKGGQSYMRIVHSILMVVVLSCGVLLSHSVTAFSQDSKPVAFIDGTLKVPVGETVYLDGTLSSDPGGRILTFLWTFVRIPEGSISVITDSNDAQASFEADQAGIYTVKLVVNNGLESSDPVYATINVTTKP
jgi:hypothetical protein